MKKQVARMAVVGQRIAGAAAGHEAASAPANAERAPFGALQEDDPYERYSYHEVDQEKNGGHRVVWVCGGAVLSDPLPLG